MLESPLDQNPEELTQKRPEDLQRAAAERTELTAQDRQAEAAKKDAEGAQIKQIQSGLNPSPQAEKPPEQQTPEELYQKLLKPKMDSVINAWGFRSVIEECRTSLSEATDENRVKTEKTVIKKLLKAFKGIPAKTWAFFPEAMAQEKAANCSGSAMILGHILNEELKIKTEQANPWNHAVNIVTYNDGSTQYVDPRNNKIHELELEECVEEKDGFRVYKIDQGSLKYGLLPVAKAEHAAGLTLMTNTVSLSNYSQKDKQASETMAKYASTLDPAFAKKYSDIHYTANPDTDPKWIAERRRVARRNITTSIPILGRFM